MEPAAGRRLACIRLRCRSQVVAHLHNHLVQRVAPHGHVALHVPQRPHALKLQARQLVAALQQQRDGGLILLRVPSSSQPVLRCHDAIRALLITQVGLWNWAGGTFSHESGLRNKKVEPVHSPCTAHIRELLHTVPIGVPHRLCRQKCFLSQSTGLHLGFFELLQPLRSVHDGVDV